MSWRSARSKVTSPSIRPRKIRSADADLGGRLGLLLASDARHRRAVDRSVEAAGLAVGDEAIRDVGAGVGELRDHTGGGEVDIVWMRHDREGALDLVDSEHDAQVEGP